MADETDSLFDKYAPTAQPSVDTTDDLFSKYSPVVEQQKVQEQPIDTTDDLFAKYSEQESIPVDMTLSNNLKATTAPATPVPPLGVSERLREERRKYVAAPEGSPEALQAKAHFERGLKYTQATTGDVGVGGLFGKSGTESTLPPDLAASTAQAKEAAFRAPYLAAKGTAGGLTLGLSDVVFNNLEKHGFGGRVEAETNTDQWGQNIGRLLGGWFTGLGVAQKAASAMGAAGMKSIIATRIATGAALNGVNAINSVLAGDRTAKEASGDFAQGLGSNIVNAFTGYALPRGAMNFISHVGGDLLYDAATDKYIRGRLTDENFKQWFVNVELPQLVSSVVFASKDAMNKDFNAERTRVLSEIKSKLRSDTAKITPEAMAEQVAEVKAQQPKAVASQQPTVSETQKPLSVTGETQAPETKTGVPPAVPTAETEIAPKLPAEPATFFEAKRQAQELGIDTTGMKSKGEVVQAIKAKQTEPVALPPEGQHEIQTVTRAGATEEALPLAQEARRTGTAFKENKPLQPIQDRLAVAEDAELSAISKDTSNPDRILAFQERMKRATSDESKQSVFDEMIKETSDAGFVLRSAGEFLKQTPEGMVEIATRLARKTSKQPLTPAQKAKLKPVAQAELDARKGLAIAEENYRANPTLENDLALVKAEAQSELATRNWIKENSKLQPRSVADTLFKVLQGRLIAPISHAYNLTVNMANQPVRGFVDMVGSAIDAIRVKTMGGKREVYNPLVGIKEKIAAISKSRNDIARIMREGGSAQGTTQAGEGHGIDSPLRSMAITLGKEKAPEHFTKMQKVSWKISHLLDALTPDAQVNFRLLASLDAPFSQGEYAKALHQIGTSLGLEGKDLSVFERLPSREAKFKAIERAQESVYQAKNPLTKMVGMLERETRKAVGPWVSNALKVGTGAVFVKTPANIAWEYIQLTTPPLAIAKGMVEAKVGNIRAAELSFARAAVGTVLLSATSALAKLGLFSPYPHDPKDKSLQYETQPPHTFNMSGFRRLITGQDPTWRKGDKVVGTMFMGFLGMAGNLMADAEADMSKLPPEERTFGTKVAKTAINMPQSLLDSLTMLKGQRMVYEAISSGRYSNITENLWNLTTTIPIPNTISTIARSSRKNMIDTRMGNLGDTMVESLKAKIPGVEAGTLRRDMWGNSIPSTPEGANAFLYNFLDATKSRNIPDKPESREVWLIEHQLQGTSSAGKAIPSIPSDKITINKKQIKLTPQQHDAYTALVGKYRLEAVKRVTTNPSWSGYAPEVKAKILSKIYDQQAERAKIIMIREFKLLDQSPTID